MLVTLDLFPPPGHICRVCLLPRLQTYIAFSPSHSMLSIQSLSRHWTKPPGVLMTLGAASLLGSQDPVCPHGPIFIHTCLPVPSDMLSAFLGCIRVVLPRDVLTSAHNCSFSLLKQFFGEAVLGQPWLKLLSSTSKCTHFYLLCTDIALSIYWLWFGLV